MLYGVDGFVYVLESLVGKYKGVVDYFKICWVIKFFFVWGMGLVVLFSLGYGLGGNGLFWLFIN